MQIILLDSLRRHRRLSTFVRSFTAYAIFSFGSDSWLPLNNGLASKQADLSRLAFSYFKWIILAFNCRLELCIIALLLNYFVLLPSLHNSFVIFVSFFKEVLDHSWTSGFGFWFSWFMLLLLGCRILWVL